LREPSFFLGGAPLIDITELAVDKEPLCLIAFPGHRFIVALIVHKPTFTAGVGIYTKYHASSYGKAYLEINASPAFLAICLWHTTPPLLRF